MRYRKKRMKGSGKRRRRVFWNVAAVGCALALQGCSAAPGVTKTQETGSSESLLSAGSYQEAADLLQAEIDGGEDTEENYRQLGIAYMGLGNYEKAVKALESAIQESGIVPTETEYDINYYLGSCYDKLGNYDEALKIYDAIVTMKPRDADALQMRGGVLMQMGDTEGMQRDFSKALSLEPANYDRLLTIYLAMSENGYEEEGRQYLQDALSEGTESMSQYDRGRIAYYAGDYETARTSLEQLPTNSDEKTVLMLGRTYEALGDYNYAANVYKTWIASDTSSAEIYNQLGLCCMKTGDYSAALEAFQSGKGLGASEALQSLSFNEIVAYERLGKFDEARTLMDSYRSAYPGDEKAAREEIFLKTR